ncbi:DNA replication/repair protein RecF [Leucobacter tardus]|uniref:DNA replication and repair protein RecF n=1 Tax=Leucobacter tardus TaxID=501483 RepID=A0A939TQ95_9MICO|nr:DNA replication/repair protein RecF [Leucobacter tardus]MBO2988722.1 DNA replication/repair protein RecF [Leucobacter tardus]
MRVAHLSLVDFRNYHHVELPLSAGANLIAGQNGQGKTNLVEAIGYFSGLRSHRVSADAPLIRSGADAAVSRMRVAVGEREVLLELQLNRDRPNRGQVNRGNVPPREVTRWFSSVLFAPEDLWIVRGDPSTRRRFLDEAVTAYRPAMSGVIADYERVLRQRTTLLKSARGGGSRRAAAEATLSVWDEQLVAFGSQIIVARRALLSRLIQPGRRAYRTLVEADHGFDLSMKESFSWSDVSRETSPESASEATVSRETVADAFAHALARSREQEFERGVSLVGPHRDDLHLSLNDLPVKGYASHGETWSFVLSLRLAIAEVLRAEDPAGDPVIILDDVFAELDATRRNRLMRAVHDFEQVIVTAAVREDVPTDAEWRISEISRGNIVKPDLQQTPENAFERTISTDFAASAGPSGGVDESSERLTDE